MSRPQQSTATLCRRCFLYSARRTSQIKSSFTYTATHPTRPFTSTPLWRNHTSPGPSGTTSRSTKDPDHPYLYYHTVSGSSRSNNGANEGTRIALSFLPDPPRQGSKTVLGYLPAGAAGLGDFQENRDFRDMLHAAIKQGLMEGKGEAADFEAEGRPGDGYIHITDERALPPAGRIGETEDLIGSVFVQDNKIVASTYEPLPSYRLFTANGPPVLPKGLDRHLIDTLQGIHSSETS